jgi:two-component system, chemotaxis family, chemotaxis protein CheY
MDLSGGILIVDDSSTSRMIISRCIEMAGIQAGAVREAEDGIQAMTILKAHPETACVLTDLNMPKMDGRSFIKLLRGNPEGKSVTVIVVSSIADSAIEADLRAMGVAAIVKKPVSPQKMKEALGGSI